MKKIDVCDLCCDFYNKFDINDMSDSVYKKIIKEYKPLMITVLRQEFEVSKKAADRIVDTLGYGNWEHLWETEKEKAETPFEISRALLGDIFYCSDRWTWDRVIRVNWMYLRLKAAVEKKED